MNLLDHEVERVAEAFHWFDIFNATSISTQMILNHHSTWIETGAFAFNRNRRSHLFMSLEENTMKRKSEQWFQKKGTEKKRNRRPTASSHIRPPWSEVPRMDSAALPQGSFRAESGLVRPNLGRRSLRAHEPAKFAALSRARRAVCTLRSDERQNRRKPCWRLPLEETLAWFDWVILFQTRSFFY